MSTTRLTFVGRLKNLDPLSWQQFVASYHPRLSHLIRSKGIPERDMKDILHDVFLKVYQTVPGSDYQIGKGSFRGWLKRITTNTIIDWHRKQKRSKQLSGASEVIAEEKTTAIRYADRRDLFQEAIYALKPRIRPATWDCFEQHALNGRIAEEVAEELQVSVNAVYVNTSRVMAQLREYCMRKEVS